MKKLKDLLNESVEIGKVYSNPYAKSFVKEEQEEPQMELSEEQKKAFFEAVKQYKKYGEAVYRNAGLGEVYESIKNMVEMAGKVTLSETDDWFDNVTVSRHMKRMGESFKVFEKTLKEVSTLQQRLEASYDEIGEVLGKYYEISEELDPVGKEDDDIDNDGDVDSSDKYLANRRKVISKAIKNESMKLTDILKNPLKNESVVTEAKDVGHYERVGNQTIVDSNFVNYSKGVLPNSELVHLGMGDFAIKSQSGTIKFQRSGKMDGIGQDFVGRPHRMTDDKNGKLVDLFLKLMLKKKKAILSMSESVNEASEEFVVYVEKDNGRKKLLHTKKSQRAANMFLTKNADKILNQSGIRTIGSMSKFHWEKDEEQYAENIKKTDMKTVTKKEWDTKHKDYKGMIKGQPYMMYMDKKGTTVYGPVNIVESVNEIASRTAMEIGGLTGMNKDAIQKFVDDNNLDIEKVFQFVKKGKLSDRMDLVSAIAGNPNNPVQKKMIKMFSESTVNEAKYDIGMARKGNGITIYNRAEEEAGDYKNVAHISDNGVVKYYDKKLPSNIKKQIEAEASKMKESVNEIRKGSIVMPYAMDTYGEFIVDKVFKNKDGETSYTGKFKKSGETKEFILHSKDKIVKESVNEGTKMIKLKDLLNESFGFGELPSSKLMKMKVPAKQVLKEGTRSQVGYIDNNGNIKSAYVHFDGYPENMKPGIKKHMKSEKDVKTLIKRGGARGIFDDKDIEYYDDKSTKPMSGNLEDVEKYIKDSDFKGGAEFVYLYNTKDKKWYFADTYKDKELKKLY